MRRDAVRYWDAKYKEITVLNLHQLFECQKIARYFNCWKEIELNHTKFIHFVLNFVSFFRFIKMFAFSSARSIFIVFIFLRKILRLGLVYKLCFLILLSEVPMDLFLLVFVSANFSSVCLISSGIWKITCRKKLNPSILSHFTDAFHLLLLRCLEALALLDQLDRKPTCLVCLRKAYFMPVYLAFYLV